MMRAIFNILALGAVFVTFSCQQTPDTAIPVAKSRDASPIIVLPERTLSHFSKSDSVDISAKRVAANAINTNDFSFKSADTAEIRNIPRRKNSLLNLLPASRRIALLPGERLKISAARIDSQQLSISYISSERRIWLQFDNDIFCNTDRYYTNGIVIGISTPAISTLVINKLMPVGPDNGSTASSLSLHHGMFTPYTTKNPPQLRNDRPYASTLFLNYSQVALNANASYKISSSIKIGVIGDAALGQLLQQSVHTTLPGNDAPLGWETQISNDLVLDYSINCSHRLINRPSVEMYAGTEVSLGTLYTQASGRLDIRLGSLDHSAGQQSIDTPARHGWKYGANTGLSLHMVGYDATLQGGLFNHDNVFTLKPNEIQRIVPQAYLGLFAGYGSFQINLTQHYLGREFKGGRHHFWGSIGLQYNY
ncbi:MAG: lipid A deacylase LpxR family protein [Lentimicrobium sp.]|jgi:hypothetical protein|nr:lipid A deacylase LpxR family protein [Lentimicrobium sp.]